MSMKIKAGEIFSLRDENRPVPGCTVSSVLTSGSVSSWVFSLAENTDISAEIYPYHKLIIMLSGELNVFTDKASLGLLHEGDAVLTPADIPLGMKAERPAIYTEISIRRDYFMNSAIKPGEIFKLAELLPTEEGKIVNMDVAHSDKMKFALMSFGSGTGLDEHAAPGQALIFALEGEGTIVYEGKEYPIKAGENFSFAKGGMHAVKAAKPFKMALFLTLE